MSQEKLREAGAILESASESVEGEAATRLVSQSASLIDLAEQDRGPDHGQVARIQEKLRELKAEVPSVGSDVDSAYQLLNEYRETLEGV